MIKRVLDAQIKRAAPASFSLLFPALLSSVLLLYRSSLLASLFFCLQFKNFIFFPTPHSTIARISTWENDNTQFWSCICRPAVARIEAWQRTAANKANKRCADYFFYGRRGFYYYCYFFFFVSSSSSSSSSFLACLAFISRPFLPILKSCPWHCNTLVDSYRQ